MTSIIKVDQIQTAAGATPTAADLGINTTGTVLQVVNAVKTDTQGFGPALNIWYDITGLSATITPKFSTSKILVHVSISFSGEGNSYIAFRMFRGSTEILYNTEAGTGINCAGGRTINSSGNMMYSVHKEIITGFDTPNTTSAITYKPQISPMRTNTKSAFVNRSYTAGDDNQFRTVSSITLTEIAG
jgi:hypothetical protein